jgi:NADH/NAD ratio-sensing transcriptional regulator Rex
MKVSQNGQEIGAIQFEDAARLAAFIKSNNVHTGIMTVLLTDLPDISGNFSVRPFKPFKNQ